MIRGYFCFSRQLVTMAKSTEPHIKYPKWFGGSASCMAVLVSHPLDLMTYGSVRIGLYETLKEQTKANDIPNSPPVLGLLAGIAGFTGAIFGNASDIGNIRMQNDGSLPPHLRRNYRHIFDAWAQIKRQEGWRAFAQGLWPNAFRCGMMTSCQLASYDSFRDLLVASTGISGDHPGLHFLASFMAALVATTVCSPIDVIKTQLMGSSGAVGVIQITKDLTVTEGVRWIFRGWTPSFARLGPQTIATLVLLEQHKRVFRSLGEGGVSRVAQ
ncbi:unnamed protein product [Penicillium salamii]|nr:unnamed protein product [Penicillium salamii]